MYISIDTTRTATNNRPFPLQTILAKTKPNKTLGDSLYYTRENESRYTMKIFVPGKGVMSKRGGGRCRNLRGAGVET